MPFGAKKKKKIGFKAPTQLVYSPRMREVRGSSPRLAKDFFHERSWLSGLFVLCSYVPNVPNVLVYDACFFLHFLV